MDARRIVYDWKEVSGRQQKKTVEIINNLKETVEECTTGDPMNKDWKWVRLSLRQLCRNMARLGCSVSPTTIERLLKDNDYALRANVKSKEPGSNHPERNAQFKYTKQTKEEFLKKGLPIISIDPKKRVNWKLQICRAVYGQLLSFCGAVSQ